MENKLTKTIEEILYSLFTDAGGYGENTSVKEIINAVKVYTDVVLGKPEKLIQAKVDGVIVGKEIQDIVDLPRIAKNSLIEEQRKRAEENL